MKKMRLKILRVVLRLLRFERYYGMCPDCEEENKKQITFCVHGVHEHFIIK